MDKEGEIAVKKIAGGAGIIFLGVLLSRFFGFVYRVLIARYLGPEDYGLISLAIAILTTAIPIAVFGLPVGVARYVSYFKSKNNLKKIKGVLNFSFSVVTVTGIVTSIILYFLAGWLAISFFHEPRLAIILKAFAFSIPLFTLKNIAHAAVRGFQQMKYRVYSETFISKTILIVATFTVLIMGFGILAATIAYIVSIIAFFVASFYFLNKLFPFHGVIKPTYINKELISFSWPLVFSAVIWAFVGHLDTIMLGYFDTAANVGIYNAAFPTAVLISVILGSFGVVFMPASTELFAKKKTGDLQKLFSIVTKWIYITVLPGFLLMLLFASPILKLFFGQKYILGAFPLSILAVGYFIASIVGPTAQMLQTLGKTKIILLNHSIVLIVDLILNFYLIPLYSIVGAAIATMIAISTWNILSLIEIYHYAKIQPYNLNYLRPTLASLLSIGLIFILKNFVDHFSLIILLGLLVLFLIVYSFLFLLFKSLEKEDIMILLALEKKLGLDLKFFKKIIKRFL